MTFVLKPKVITLVLKDIEFDMINFYGFINGGLLIFIYDFILAEVNGHHHSSFDFDPRNPMASLENNPNVPKNCTITRPPPITRPGG